MPRKRRTAFEDLDVAAVFDGYPAAVRAKLLALRELILQTAQAARVGPMEETLKWGQPSYRPRSPKTGTSIRIDSKTPNHYALYVHCQTDLVDRFRKLYPQLKCVGNREVAFDVADEVPEDPVRHCVSLALTYHRDRSK